MANEGRREQEVHYLVVSRSCAYLYEEIAELFADRPDIKVIVDRRRGPISTKEIQEAGERRRRRTFELVDGEPDGRPGT